MADPFATWPVDAMNSPATRAVALTASATAFDACRAIHCDTAQSIVCRFADDTASVTLAVVAGATYPYRIKLLSTGTGVTALY